MSGLPPDLWQSVWLTVELAAITTIILLVVATPLACTVVAEVDLDVIIRSRIPWAALVIERMTRASDDPPACFRKQLYCCVSNAARGTGQHHGLLLG